MSNFHYAAAGDKSNDRITQCKICARNGQPHEPIDFQRIEGNILADGTQEIVGWRVVNYFDGNQHKHKKRRDIEGAQE